MFADHRSIISILAFVVALYAFSGCTSQDTSQSNDNAQVEHRKSPIAISTLDTLDTYIKVVYGQPYKRGRKIFGGLEEYGKVWRTGANEATEITFTKRVQLNGNEVPAGTYALFTIPGRDEWTIILNQDLGQWGAFNYNKEYDFLRTTVPTDTTKQTVEAFTIRFTDVQEYQTQMVLLWDRSRVEVPIRLMKPE